MYSQMNCCCIVQDKDIRDKRFTFHRLIPPDTLKKNKKIFHGNLPFTYLVNHGGKTEGVIGGY